ncbi:MAG: serine/threonine protein kinase [Bauldia sp.]
MSPGSVDHASVALIGESGVLIRGASGSGKSSLLLAILSAETGSTALVADDRVRLAAHHGRLVATCPDELAGMMEVRGTGIVRRPFVSPVVVDLVVDLAPAAVCPRLPLGEADARVAVESVVVPRVFVPIGAVDGSLRVNTALEQVAREKR